ncbi:MAG: rotamase [Alphaproteobacteria bacterium]|nr:rotamase [Alphaproteobacteria bacterium]
MKRLIVFAAFVVFSAFAMPSAQAREEGIAAIVNEDAVTTSDLRDRMKLITVSSGLPQTGEMREKIEPQILTMLIEETIKLQEARRNNIEVSSEDIDEAFASLAGQNKMTPEQFRDVLVQGGIPERTLRDQIRAQIAWTRVVQGKLHPQIAVTDADVAARGEQLRTAIGKTEYFVSEIFLPTDASSPEGEVRALASRLLQELRKGAPFPAVAQQFSQSPGASKGGDIGWVQADQLPAEVSAALASMEEGQISEPIRTPRGFHIVALRKARQITEDTIPPDNVMRNQIGIERLDRMQQRLLLDLKSTAFIEHRI